MTILKKHIRNKTPPPTIAFTCHDSCSLLMKAAKTSLKPEQLRLRTGLTPFMATKVPLCHPDHLSPSTPSLYPHTSTDWTNFSLIIRLGSGSCWPSWLWLSCGRSGLRWSSCRRSSLWLQSSDWTDLGTRTLRWTLWTCRYLLPGL